MKNFLVLLSEKLRTKKVRVSTGFVLILCGLIVTNSLTLLLYSVVCTLGAGLVLWLAAAYIIGAALSMIIDLLTGSGRQELALDEEKALEVYVREAKDQQLPRLDVEGKLNSAGWNDELIAKVINSVYGQEKEG